MKRRVAITGVGAVTPLGVGASTLHTRWAAGECGIRDGEAGCVDFEPSDFLSKKQIRRTDRFTQLAMAAAAEATDAAGWSEALPCEPDRMGCVIGTGVGGIRTMQGAYKLMYGGGRGKVSPLTVPLMMPNAASAVVAMRYGLQGHVYGIVSACAASAHAIGTGARMIQAGDADAVLAGGSESALIDLTFAGFSAMEALSPTGTSRPFDARRDGFVLGEGAGVVLLEAESTARERGAPIIGEMLGYGASCDAHHLTAPEPDGGGGARAIARALDDAGLGPEAVDYVNAHGTSTLLNDRIETAALKNALGARAWEIPVSSTKSAIGHLLGAAGATEAVATVEALLERLAPPTLGYEEAEEGLDLDYVPDGPRPLEGNGNGNGDGASGQLVALSNSFGFGGHNAVLCLGSAR
jgi:3-oxoacyl-[acyl-carrier-protein] synthase II